MKEGIKNKKKYLHLCHIGKFTNDYIKFVNNNFNSEEHFFLVFGERNFHINEGKIFINIEEYFYTVYL